MNEGAFMKRITDYCDWVRVRWHHETDSRRSKSGMPDLILCGPGGVAFVECKSDTGRIRPEQRAWIEALQPHVHAGVYRPSDWDDVRALLDRLAGGDDA